jgi:hypothetical protein
LLVFVGVVVGVEVGVVGFEELGWDFFGGFLDGGFLLVKWVIRGWIFWVMEWDGR